MAVILDIAINGTSWDNAWTTTHPEYYMRSGTTIRQLGNFSDIALLFMITGLKAKFSLTLNWDKAASIGLGITKNH